MFLLINRIFALLAGLCFFTGLLPLGFPKDEPPNLDFETILAGIRYYDSLMKSGEGEVIYKRVQTPSSYLPPNLGDVSMEREYYLIFNQKEKRMELKECFCGDTHYSKTTYLNTKGGAWTIGYRKSKPHYMFMTNPHYLYESMDPRWPITTRWNVGSSPFEGSLSEYLGKRGFKVNMIFPSLPA
ncbi:TPA: hypothetical protein EYP66_03105 [Candidatus Poribacteria bacterium]|nr:hypothetical protein [Candidatus Poribacteria bacterium]